jgi:hypothetical protein
MSLVEHPEEPSLRLFTVDDPRLWDARPRLSPEEFALDGLTDDEWDVFHAALAEV